VQILLPKIDNIEIEYDANVVAIRTGDDPKKPLYLALPDPIYTAVVIDIAAGLAADPTRL
jgi:hypothetical protein